MRLTAFNVKQQGHMRVLLVGMLLVAAMIAGVMSWQAMQKDFETLDGSQYRWSDFSGKWVVVNYFAEWCAPCLREIPELVAFHAEKPADTTIFAVSYDPLSKERIRELKDKYQIHLPLVVPDEKMIMPMERPPYLPATFIIGPDGRVKKTLMGEVSETLLSDTINALKSQSL
ncbi:TlpA family protein disulfide reductase [Alteromonas sp. H39]|uniref:TlpA family protein disulfide reductase n=1 Tax=Alteromonas sp. H39 TaxID=3389876 RepID=UPI0039DF7DFA